MSARTESVVRSLKRRGYGECRVPEHCGYRRFRVDPGHARRIEHYCARLRRKIFGDIFVCENGQILLGQTRTLCVALNSATVETLLIDGQQATRKPIPRVTITLEELLA